MGEITVIEEKRGRRAGRRRIKRVKSVKKIGGSRRD